MQLVPYQGEWTQLGEEIVGVGLGAGSEAWAYYDTVVENGFIEATVSWPVVGQQQAMFMLRSTGRPTQQYRIEVWGNAAVPRYRGRVVIYREAAPPVFLYDDQGFDIPDGSLVRAIVEGDVITVMVNDLVVAQAVDPNPLPAGYPGLGVIWDYTTVFSDVRVSQPSRAWLWALAGLGVCVGAVVALKK